MIRKCHDNGWCDMLPTQGVLLCLVLTLAAATCDGCILGIAPLHHSSQALKMLGAGPYLMPYDHEKPH